MKLVSTKRKITTITIEINELELFDIISLLKQHHPATTTNAIYLNELEDILAEARKEAP